MICMSPGRRLFTGLVIAAAIGVVFVLAFSLNLFHGLQLQTSDYLFQAANLKAGPAPDDKITIITIDDESLERLGLFSSWPRSYHARLIDNLSAAGARTIVFDILFAEPTEDDTLMASAIRRAGNVILPLVCTLTIDNTSIAGNTVNFESSLRPVPVLAGSASTIAHANIFPDYDGVVRKLPIIIPDDEQYLPSLSLAAVAKYLRRPDAVEAPVEDEQLSFAGRSVTLDKTNSMFINYLDGSARALNFSSVSYVDVLEGKADAALIRDRIVVIGITGTGLGDTFWTPMGQMTHGVKLHASAMRTILTGNFLRQAPSATTIITILFLALLCGLAVLRLRMLWSASAGALLIVFYYMIAFSLFDRGIILNMVYPPMAVIGVSIGLNVHHLVTERAEKREITNIFGRYVSTSVVDRILSASEEQSLKLGGEETQMTTLFADIRHFTRFSEEMPPQELVSALNLHLTRIVESVIRHDGMVNKFGGDNVMAVWNVPMKSKDHALLAVKAAIDAQREITRMHRRQVCSVRMEFGIGVNTGKAVAGNMGSEDRLEYSVIGDAVNTAARLADIAPGGKVWIGASTYELISDHVIARPLELMKVKGKAATVQAYEVLDIIENKDSRNLREIGPGEV